MKRIIFMIFLCMALMAGYAQRLSHTFDKASFSKVLVWLDKAQPQYKINFIYVKFFSCKNYLLASFTV